MYLISIYFDDKTNHRIQSYINKTAKGAGNTFMLDKKVPPHITISSFETRDEQAAIEKLKESAGRLNTGTLQWVSVGAFLPSVLYITPVLSEYLHKMSKEIYESISQIQETIISSYYQPLQWLPHVTVGKNLSEEEMQKAFKVMQKQFVPFLGQVVRIGLAKTNPYTELITFEL